METTERLRLIRTKLGYSQNEFANGLGVKQGSYSDIERGKVKQLSESMLILLELNFGISRHWVETGEGPEMNYERDTKYRKTLLEEATELWKERAEAPDEVMHVRHLLKLLAKKEALIVEKEKELVELRAIKKGLEQILNK